MHPDWLGSPQHLIGGIVLAAAVALVAVRHGWRPLSAALLGFALTGAAEAALEVVEYPLLYSDHPHVSAYYDTIADLANSVVGAAIGAAAALVALRRRTVTT